MASAEPFPLYHEHVLGMVRAAERAGFSDEQIGRLIDVCGFGDTLIPDWGPSFNPTPQSDGVKLHAIPCGALAGPDHGGLTAGEMPTDAELDASNARAAERRSRMRLVVDGMDGGGM